MPIKIPDTLPALKILESENIFVITNKRAAHQDIRPLKILLLNLMPKKIETETQLLRLLGNTPLQVEIELIKTATHVSKNTPVQHLLNFYKEFNDIKNEKYDGMIITGAPVELLPFEQVDYWDELCEIMAWSKTHVHSTMHICWGAQAGLFYHYGIPKYERTEKLSGIFKHELLEKNHPLTRGFDDVFMVPHSRYTEVRAKDIQKCDKLTLLAYSKKAGVHIVTSKNGKRIFIAGHAEYDRETLQNEYIRDIKRGINIKIPENYYINDDSGTIPPVTWRSHADLLFSNWLNYYVYQSTPYDITQINDITQNI